MAFPNDFFCSVSVMSIKIHNSTAFTHQSFIWYRMHCTSSDAIKYTKTAWFSAVQQTIYACMMAWWSNDTKCVSVSSDQHAKQKNEEEIGINNRSKSMCSSHTSLTSQRRAEQLQQLFELRVVSLHWKKYQNVHQFLQMILGLWSWTVEPTKIIRPKINLSFLRRHS